MRVRYLAVSAVLAACSAMPAWANMAVYPLPQLPDSGKSVDWTSFKVRVDYQAARTRLVIPKRVLVKRSEFQRLPAVGPRQQSGGDLRSRTVVAGVTLSLLLAGGGAVTVLIRRRQGRAAVVTTLALLAIVGICASPGVADLLPPSAHGRPFELNGPFSPKVPAMIPPAMEFPGSVIVEPVEEGDTVTLIIGRDLARSFSYIQPPPPRRPAGNAAPTPTAPR